MAKKKTSKRNPPISYRPPVALQSEFEKRVERSGLSVSAYLTQCVFEKTQPRQLRRPMVEKSVLGKSIAYLGKISDELELYCREDDEELKDLIRDQKILLIDLRNLFMAALGRKK